MLLLGVEVLALTGKGEGGLLSAPAAPLPPGPPLRRMAGGKGLSVRLQELTGVGMLGEEKEREHINAGMLKAFRTKRVEEKKNQLLLLPSRL